MKQRTWWAVGAGVIAALELMLVVGIWLGRIFEDRTQELGSGVTVTEPSELGPVWWDVVFTGLMGLAAAAIISGLYLLNRQPHRARSLLLAGLAPATLAGAVFFWFPPFWLVSAVAVACMVGVARHETKAPVAA